jgi:hypothetical protein
MGRRDYVISLDGDDDRSQHLEELMRDVDSDHVDVMRIMTPTDAVHGGIGLLEALSGIKPAPPTPPGASTSSDGASTDPAPPPVPSDAYPAEALVAAIGSGVAPSTLWAKVRAEERPDLAKWLLERAASARLDLLKKSQWATAPEMALLDLCGEAEMPELARKLLEARTDTTAADRERRTADTDLAKEKVNTARRVNEMLGESLEQMREWRKLAGLGKWMLIGASAFSAIAIIGVLVLAAAGKLGEVETPIIIFALAVFAISPAVLLLRERPLEGLDKWSPSGPVKEEAKPEGGGGEDGSTSSSSTKTST